MKTTTKIIFGAALSVFSVALASPQTFAANRDVSSKFNATGKIDGIGQFSIQAEGLTDGVEATDFIEITAKNLQHNGRLNNSQVISNGVTVGTVSSVFEEYQFSKVINKPVDNSVTPSYSDGKIKIIFNENISKFQNANFSISSQNNFDWMEVDRDWSVDSALIFKGNKIAEKSTSFKKANIMSVDKTSVNAGGMYWDVSSSSNYGFNITLNNDGADPFKAGSIIKVTVPETSAVRLKNLPAREDIQAQRHFNFIGVDTPKNIHGVYFTSTNPKLRLKMKAVTGNVAEFELLDNAPAQDAWFYFAIRNALNIVRYENVNETEKTMPFDAKFELFYRGQKISESNGARMTFTGSGVEAFLKQKEEEKKEPEVQDEPKIEEEIQEPKSPEIQAPNTGFSGGISALSLSAVGLLATVSALFFKKK